MRNFKKLQRRQPPCHTCHLSARLHAKIFWSLFDLTRMSKPRSYPTAKRAALGNTARPNPSWKAQPDVKREGFKPLIPPSGSRIMVSQLPQDVGEAELDELFTATIGPLHDVFVIYNKLQQSRGMAIIHFKNSLDAKRARDRYHGKVIDGRVPMRIDYITEINPSSIPNAMAAVPTRPRTLMERINMQSRSPDSHAYQQPPPLINRTFEPPTFRYQPTAPAAPAPRTFVYGRPRRIKKGPRRANKPSRPIKSLADLDKEMDEYRHAKKYLFGSPEM